MSSRFGPAGSPGRFKSSRSAPCVAGGPVRLLGTVPAAPGRPLLEVWLVRRLGKGLAVPEGMQIQWVPLSEVVERVGAPVLHEPRTLAALAVAARSELVPEWPNGPRPPGAARDAVAVSQGGSTPEWGSAWGGVRRAGCSGAAPRSRLRASGCGAGAT